MSAPMRLGTLAGSDCGFAVPAIGSVAEFNAINATADDFTVIYLPDTQYYSESFPEIFDAQTQWIADNAVALKIKMVLHVGDVVDNAAVAQEWIDAGEATNILQVAGIPNLIGIGNQDYNTVTRELALFLTTFPVSRYTGAGWFNGGFYDGARTDNVYMTLTVGAFSYLFMAIEYDPRPEVITWAESIIVANPTKWVMLESHAVMGAGNSMIAQGTTLWNMLRRYPKALLVGSGHVGVDPQPRRVAQGDACQVVHLFAANYPTDPNGGNGYLRIIKIKPNSRKMLAQTYSPTLDAYLTVSGNEYVMSW